MGRLVEERFDVTPQRLVLTTVVGQKGRAIDRRRVRAA
jgi:hypothetical protein